LWERANSSIQWIKILMMTASNISDQEIKKFLRISVARFFSNGSWKSYYIG
jgi:hypothetical protein